MTEYQIVKWAVITTLMGFGVGFVLGVLGMPPPAWSWVVLFVACVALIFQALHEVTRK
jgi:hypothetical protein